ncbi:MAG: hypothetical protein L0Y66_12965 [Myxococcaceae bacterium]|nr:hypothetical protein [Myxococcaceae bacterium]MCI0671084.1 hypothetical protein [Myxococcaceae bacterium]
MDPFVRQLVQRLNHPARPLSRNRHFHTFETPEGRAALRTSRRLRSLQRDILACHREAGTAHVAHTLDDGGQMRIELSLTRLRGRRVTHLSLAEWELLLELAGVRDALAPADEGPR